MANDVQTGEFYIVQLQIIYLHNYQCIIERNVPLMRGPLVVAESLVWLLSRKGLDSRKMPP